MERGQVSNFPTIEKEKIVGLHFPQNEVLQKKSDIETRQRNLDEACRFGNEFKGKVRILFQSESGIFEVHTTIWNVSDSVVSLKAGVFIPIHCIYTIEKI